MLAIQVPASIYGLSMFGIIRDMRIQPDIHTLADNLNFLRRRLGHGGKALSTPQVAKRCGVSQRFVSNIANAAVDRPSVTHLCRLGDGLGVGWRIFDPDLPVYYDDIEQIERLSSYYGQSSAEGRQTILRVAESVSGYKR